MSFFPIHTIGITNLWIGILLYFIPLLLTVLLRKGVFRRSSKVFSSHRSRLEFRIFITSKMVMLAYLFYSITVPIQPKTGVFWAGALLFGCGYLLYCIAWINVAASKRGAVFTRGLYRFSRHPIYFTSAMIFLALGLMSGSWFFLACSLLMTALHLYNGYAEERICEEVFGDEYRTYRDHTPRWIGLPKKG